MGVEQIMSEERLQEIKDSISLQYKVQEANDLDNFNIFTDEEQELVDEIERLKERIEDLNTINEEHRILNGEIRKELQQKENIIKEVREVINKGLNINSDYVEYDFGTELLRQEVLEILDKGSDEISK